MRVPTEAKVGCSPDLLSDLREFLRVLCDKIFSSTHYLLHLPTTHNKIVNTTLTTTDVINGK
jgi:hypothetical protein